MPPFPSGTVIVSVVSFSPNKLDVSPISISSMTSDIQSTYFGIGRRKTSVAKVILVSGTGSMVVNHKPGELCHSG